MSVENPYLPPEFGDRLRSSLPDNDPANEVENLTLVQRFALPVLLWFFDGNRYRGQGRSELMAEVMIQLAIRNGSVYLNDLSTFAYNPNDRRLNSYFGDAVLKRIDRVYPKHIFEYKQTRFELVFRGIRP